MRKDYKLEKRKYIIGGFIILIAIIYSIRLFDLQINDERYKKSADSNAFLKKTVFPSRGLMYDRNGELVVYNQPAYDVMLIPRDVQPFDTLDFCETIHLTPEQLRKRLSDMRDKRLNPGYSSYTPQKLITQLSTQDYGRLQEKLYRFPGFYIQKRILRQYNYATAANVLGNLREVSQKDIDNDSYYAPGDYTGDLGVERSYEPYLRGIKGVEILIRDARGRIQGRYENGAHDIEPISGRDLKLSLDIKLQQYAESLMVGKRGAVVAIEPKTGEILCLVSSPSYDPRLLVGRPRGQNYKMLTADESLPLFDRALVVDLPHESRGFLPNAKFYSKFYGEGHWSANTVISVAIGQGEILATPLQIANLSATIANRGWFITPHAVKEITDTILPSEYTERRRPTIDEHWYADIAEGMRMAVTGGTCRRAAIPGIEVAGKTGTAQNPHDKDHSAFMGFAPYDDPKIAVAVYVENGGFGAVFGVPIGSLVMEKYLTDTISPSRKYMEEQMLNTSVFYASKPKR